jgi:hypothetical protein
MLPYVFILLPTTHCGLLGSEVPKALAHKGGGDRAEGTSPNNIPSPHSTRPQEFLPPKDTPNSHSTAAI